MNPQIGQRRRYERLPLRVPVRFNLGSNVIHCLTENISSEGFYFICPQPLDPGQRLEVDLVLPASDRSGGTLRLRCEVEVVRLDSVSLRPGFGIGCRIDNYTLAVEDE